MEPWGWAAMDEVYPQTRHQRCWVHKTANILNSLPKSSQPKAKQAIHEIWQAETKFNAEKAFELFIETYQDKYPKATLSLQKDREELLAFYDFPAKHWQSIRRRRRGLHFQPGGTPLRPWSGQARVPCW